MTPRKNLLKRPPEIIEIEEKLDDTNERDLYEIEQIDLLNKLVSEQKLNDGKRKRQKPIRCNSADAVVPLKNSSYLDTIQSLTSNKGYCIAGILMFCLSQIFLGGDAFLTCILCCSAIYLFALASDTVFLFVKVLLTSSCMDLINMLKYYYNKYKFNSQPFQTKQTKQSRFAEFRRKRRKSQDVTNYSEEKLARSDPFFLSRGETLLDLTTSSEGEALKINFKIPIKLEDQDTVLAEIDSDSHLSIIAESYFDKYLSKKTINFIDESPTRFSGMGSDLTSPYPPMQLNFQVGGVKLSGRFVVSPALTSSPLLIGSDLMYKYKLSLVAHIGGGWRLQVGPEPMAQIPCIISHKIVSENESFTVKKLENELYNDYELEAQLEPGFLLSGVIDKTKELDFIRKHEKIPEHSKQKIISCLEKIPELFSGKEFSEKHFPSNIFEHDIEFFKDAPLSLTAKPYKTTGIRLAQLKDDINQMILNKVLVPGDSHFTSPVFYVLKKQSEGKTACKGRLCFDYRKLNELIKPLHFPLNNVKNFFQEAANFKIFTVLDIKNAFLSIALTKEAQKAAAIITPFGTFLPTRTPFGLKTSPSAFCSAMSIVLSDLKFCQFYVDDILIGAENEEDMTNNLIIVFERLAKYNLKIQLSKTKFFENELKILGVIFSKTGRRIDPDKTSAIEQFPPIKTLKQCQAFLGMLAFISSFIPHFSTAMAPVFHLLKGQKDKKFTMTAEADLAISNIKKYLQSESMIYNPDFSKPLYLTTDASQVGIGAFLYQVDVYDKTPEGEKECLAKLGYIPETNLGAHLLPGVSPGRHTPIVTDFLKYKEDDKKYDHMNVLNSEVTMTEKLTDLDTKIIHVRPIVWYSKLFSSSQQLKYTAMEKEFLGLMLATLNFRDYIESAVITYILTDSQPVLWALRHKDETVKLSRYLLKLFEMNVNLVFVHLEGKRNSVADFLSRMYMVEDNTKKAIDFKPKSAQHVIPSFPPFSVVTKEQVIEAFNDSSVVICKEPAENLCHLNVNSFLYRGLGPFEHNYTCLDTSQATKQLKIKMPSEYRYKSANVHIPKTVFVHNEQSINKAETSAENDYVSRKITKQMEHFGFTPTSLQRKLTNAEIIKHQRNDVNLSKIITHIEEGNVSESYYLSKNILNKKFKNESLPHNIVLPRSLVPFALAMLHFRSHSGKKKTYSAIRGVYWWKKMIVDISKFVGGCILCSTVKCSNAGKSEIGTPRKILSARYCWQMDIVSGLPPVQGHTSYINFVDMFSGYTLPVPLKNENSDTIANIIEKEIIKPFGVPVEISSDNAANLSGPAVQKLLRFYGVLHRKTVPYSPQSHGLVEIQNRYVTQLIKLFSAQFRSTWLEVVTLAAITINSMPRPVLENNSPHFLMFASNPESNDLKKDDFFDLNEYTKRSINNRNFAKLLQEYLLKHREKQNERNGPAYKSFPKDTLVYVKDQRLAPNRKMKSMYLKSPQKIIKEYRCTVYCKDLFGRIFKHSKNNIKRAGDRSLELFASLPSDIQAILGSPLDTEIWSTIFEDGEIPDYLENYEIDFGEDRITRQNIPEDTHLVEQELAPGNGLDDDDDIEMVLEDKFVSGLKKLHANDLLETPNMSLKDAIRLINQPNQTVQNKTIPIPTNVDKSDITAMNILPEGTKRKVRFLQDQI